MKITEEKLREILIAPGHVSAEDFSKSVKEANEQNKSIEEILVGNFLIKDEQLGQLIAEDAGYRFANLKKERVDPDVLDLIPEVVSHSKEVAAFSRSADGVKVGMVNPGDVETLHLIEKRIGQKAIPYYITKRDLEEALMGYKNSLKDEFRKILKRFYDKALSKEERDEAVVDMVDSLFAYGYQNRASDIHIEPLLKKILVRFRIDGVMHDVLDVDKEFADLILTRIKIMAKMRTDEHQAAQDGKLRLQENGYKEPVDVRVSIVPVTEGENVVMRVLSSHNRQFSLTDLGLGEADLKKINQEIKNPHGMVLVTGPTGCGKTTTLYAVMKILNTREVHVSTIEDPVEYEIEGVSQIQVNPKTNLTFAKGLRAIVRQDPDIIMVGEIRDSETAGIAINSALTGHLVLSTLHTNDAATTLPRLIDMGAEPFLVASTVNVCIAQRLVRKICEKCRVSYNLTDEEKVTIEEEPRVKEIFENKKYKNLDKVVLYKGTGCGVCGGTGYTDRIGIFEVLPISDELKKLVVRRASSDEIMKTAIASGMTTMLEDGLDKVFRGVTTLKEVLRVARE